MPAPIVWGLGVAAGGIVGWLGLTAGRRVVDDLDALGDVAVAGAAGYVAARVSESPAAGLATGLAAIWVIRKGRG